MFDFLSEGDEEQTARRKVAKKAKRRVMPTIRKPVPVSKSGPILPPKPGDPVEPPPPLTTGKGTKSSVDLDFLDEPSITSPDLRPVSKQRKSSTRPDNVRSIRETPANDEDIELAREFSSLERTKRDELDFGSDWREGLANHEYAEESRKEGIIRWLSLSIAAVLLFGGGSYLYFSGKLDQLIPAQVSDDDFLSAGQIQEPSSTLEASDNPTASNSVQPEVSSTNEVIEDTIDVVAEEPTVQPSALMQRFRDQLSALENLVNEGALDEAAQSLASMDRTLYGYGASEFQAIEARIAELRSQADVQKDAEERAEALRIEQLRQAEAEAARAQAAEAARLAEAQRAAQLAAEQERAAEQEAARLEQVRLAQQQAEALRRERELALQQEQARIEAAAERAQAQQQATAEESARSEAAKLEAERLEQLRQARSASENAAAARAEKIRLDALEETAREEARRQIAEADRIATDKRIAEERAAAERRAALEQRLERAREIEEANAAAERAASRAQAGVAPSSSNSQRSSVVNNASVAQAPRAITDEELQVVYRRFTALQDAISERDIGQVVSLTKRSGLRVQQFMQVFENSVGIDVRIRNVSTSNATGEINGTLQIQSIERADGSRAVPPANMQSIRLTTNREGNGWSAISW